MRLAWFRPATHVSDRLDDTAALVSALGAEHEVEVFDEARAHDFIRLDFRAPFDLCVFELADTVQHAFVWPYLLHVPGVLRLRSLSVHDSRTEELQRQHRERDRALELAFGGWDLTAAPMLASRVTVVSDAHAAARLQRAYPAALVRVAPLGVGSAQGLAQGSAEGAGLTQGYRPAPRRWRAGFFAKRGDSAGIRQSTRCRRATQSDRRVCRVGARKRRHRHCHHLAARRRSDDGIGRNGGRTGGHRARD